MTEATVDLEGETKEKTNILPWTELGKLPKGIGFKESEDFDSDQSPGTRLGRLIEEIYKEKGISRHPFFSGQPQYHIGIIIPELRAYRQGTTSDIIAEEILKIYPNLYWMRGTTLREDEKGWARLDNVDNNGFVGNVSMLHWVEKNYYGQKRNRPALYVARFADLVQGVREGALKLGSEHMYDITIWADDMKKFKEWNRRSLKAYDFSGTSSEEIKTAQDVLNSLAI